MRITANPADKRRPIVTLDGVDVTKLAWLADDERGEVHIYPHKPDEPVAILSRGYDDVPADPRAALPRLSPRTEIVGDSPEADEKYGPRGYVVRGKVEITFKELV